MSDDERAVSLFCVNDNRYRVDGKRFCRTCLAERNRVANQPYTEAELADLRMVANMSVKIDSDEWLRIRRLLATIDWAKGSL